MIFLILLVFLFLCWGSFLNVVGYRLTGPPSHYLTDQQMHWYSWLIVRSFCPSCHITIKWYDLIPLVSWFILRGKCRTCKEAISPLYPLIELLTALVFTALIFLIEPRFWLSYGIFFSALIVSIRTDAETMYISRFMTLPVLVLGVILSALGFLPVSLIQSLLGALFGYGLLWTIGKVFYLVKKQEGIGEGDFELLGTIGAFTGIVGAWFSLLIGAFLGTVAAVVVLMQGGSRTSKIPFGPWLALGAIISVFFQEWLITILFP